MDPILQQLAAQAGIVYMPNAGGMPQMLAEQPSYMLHMAQDGAFAYDAQPALITTSNSGIPSFLSIFVDPKVIKVLVQPMKAVDVIGSEVKKGDWTTSEAMFTMVESTGQVSSYGDYSESGVSGANMQFPRRQPYHYQLFTSWGEKELAMAGLTQVDWANQQNIASVLALNKFQNETYFFGVRGLINYGLLNDPALYTPIVPTTKTAGGVTWAVATPTEILLDVAKLYGQLLTQCNQLIDLETAMTLAMSSQSEKWMTTPNSFGISAFDMIKKAYPNLVIKTAPQYSTTAGELLQLIVNEFEGQRTVDAAFTEKLRAHPVVIGSSSFKQKKSQGTFGAIIYMPMFIAQMLGV